MPLYKKNMRKKGEITVFLSMIALIFIGFIYAVIRSAQISTIKVNISSIVDIAMNSVFSEYSIFLFDKYGLMYVDTSYKGASDGGDETLLYKLNQYIDVNSALSSNISYLSSDALRFSHASDNDYISFKKQIRSSYPGANQDDEEVLDAYIRKHSELYDWLYETEFMEEEIEGSAYEGDVNEDDVNEDYVAGGEGKLSFEDKLEVYLESTEYEEKLERLISLIEEDARSNNPYFDFDNLVDAATITVYMQDSYGKEYECTRSLSLTK